MKKLIVPILVGVLMFAAAFGGAFYYYRDKDERAAAAVRTLAEEALGDLQRTGHTPAMTARLLVVVPATAAPAADKGEEDATKPLATPSLLAVPATVRYDLDLRDARPQDIAWDAKKKALRVKVPALTLSEPQIDSSGIRALSGTHWVPSHSALDAEARKAALGQLLSQAREDGALGFARDTARKTVERAFAAKLREEGEKASVEVRFADEKSVDHGGAHKAAAPEE